MNTDSTSARVSRRSAGLQSLLNLGLVIVILVIVNYLGFKYYKHKDLSSSQFYTLSPKTVEVMKTLDAPLNITTLLLNPAQPQYWDQTADLLKEYQREGGKNVTLDKLDAAYDMPRAKALQDRLHFSGTENLIIFEYKGNNRIVKQSELFDSNPMSEQPAGFKGEQQFTSSILSLIEGKVSKLYYTEGHGEHSLQDSDTQTGYGILGQSLKSENIDLASVNLATRGDIPADADAVVIGGPSIAFSPVEVQALDKYLASNGKVFVLADPYVHTGLDDLLKKYGMSLDDDIVLHRTLSAVGTESTEAFAAILQGGFSTHPITAKMTDANVQLLIQNARSITIVKDPKGQANPKTQFLLQTDPDAWGWILQPAAPVAPGAKPIATPVPTNTMDVSTRTFDKATDLAGPLTIAAVYDGGTITDPATKATVGATRIVVVGSAGFVDNESLNQTSLDFSLNTLDWMVKKNAVLNIGPKNPQEYGLTISPMQYRTVVWISLIFIPGIAFACGFVTWISRRK